MLSRFETVDAAHALAARRELRNIMIYRPDVQALRSSSTFLDEPHLTADGNHLAAVLARLQETDKHLLKDVSRDLINLVHNVVNIEVDRVTSRGELNLVATLKDNRRVAAHLLSDGTLRMLALAVMRRDPQRHGLICYEEPETGVHPAVLKRLVTILRAMATDTSEAEQISQQLRQVLVTTHSPALVSHLDIQHDELLFATTSMRVVPRKYSFEVTRMYPVRQDCADKPEQIYALHHVIEYLNNPQMEEQRHTLRETTRR